jgi:hypothetical protein
MLHGETRRVIFQMRQIDAARNIEMKYGDSEAAGKELIKYPINGRKNASERATRLNQ